MKDEMQKLFDACSIDEEVQGIILYDYKGERRIEIMTDRKCYDLIAEKVIDIKVYEGNIEELKKLIEESGI